MNRILTIAGLVLGVAGSAIAADTYMVDTVHSDVSFKIRHLISKTAGRFSDFDGTITTDFQNLDASSVKFTIKAASIDTRSEDRDKHLRSPDFFDVEKYPQITFVSSKIAKTGDNTFDVTGTLTMHGVENRITLPVTWLGEAKDPWGAVKAGFETSVTLNRKDYGISWNKALDAGGLVLGEDVEIEINLEVERE
jgi:polyisoprenoid-binding protein YceI